MRESAAGIEAWRDALLREDSGRLLGLARNYFGAVKTPFDKRDLVRYIENFLRKPETLGAIIALLDWPDLVVLGSIARAGPIQDSALKALFSGEMPLAELGGRLVNLQERLLIFKLESGGEGQKFALNPLLEEEVARIASDPAILFGPAPGGDTAVDAPPPQEADGVGGGMSLRMLALTLFAFISDHPGALKKDGSLSARAHAALERVCPGIDPGSAGAILGAFARSAHAEGGKDESRLDVEALERLFAQHWEDLHWRLVLMRTGGDMRAAQPLAAALEPCIAQGLLFSRSGLARMLRIACFARGFALDDPGIVDAMLEFGIIAEGPRGSVRLVPGSVTGCSRTGAALRGERVLAAEGSGVLHLLPEAGLEDRLVLIGAASPRKLSGVWDFELERGSARRAFARGIGVQALIRSLESMSGRTLPQTLSFSIASWGEEYAKLRLFRGTVMAVDVQTEGILEASGVAASLGMEKIASGMYFLGNVAHERIEEALKSIGMDAPPASRAPLSRHEIPMDVDLSASASQVPLPTVKPVVAVSELPPALQPVAGRWTDGSARATRSLLSLLDDLNLSGGVRADLGERISRKLVLGGEQLRMLAGVKPAQGTAAGTAQAAGQQALKKAAPFLRDQVAGAMDYQGKLRLVRHALKSPLDRLDVQWTSSDGSRRSASLRPTGLEQNQKGHTVEGEDLGSGSPLRINVGAMSAVRLVRASYFGDET